MFQSTFHSCVPAAVPNTLELSFCAFCLYAPALRGQLQLCCSRCCRACGADGMAQPTGAAAAAERVKWLCLQCAQTQSTAQVTKKTDYRKITWVCSVLPLAVVILLL